jgi:predicted metal-dependent hydrolase
MPERKLKFVRIVRLSMVIVQKFGEHFQSASPYRIKTTILIHADFFCKFDERTIVMDTKLTLTIERSVIEKAKKYAKNHGRSLSDIVENYLKALTVDESSTPIDITPKVRSLKGSFKLPSEVDYKKELADRLFEKYLS